MCLPMLFTSSALFLAGLNAAYPQATNVLATRFADSDALAELRARAFEEELELSTNREPERHVTWAKLPPKHIRVPKPGKELKPIPHASPKRPEQPPPVSQTSSGNHGDAGHGAGPSGPSTSNQMEESENLKKSKNPMNPTHGRPWRKKHGNKGRIPGQRRRAFYGFD